MLRKIYEYYITVYECITAGPISSQFLYVSSHQKLSSVDVSHWFSGCKLDVSLLKITDRGSLKYSNHWSTQVRYLSTLFSIITAVYQNLFRCSIFTYSAAGRFIPQWLIYLLCSGMTNLQLLINNTLSSVVLAVNILSTFVIVYIFWTHLNSWKINRSSWECKVNAGP